MCVQAGNQRADTPAKTGTSRYKGVSWSNRSRKWRAQLWFSNNVRCPEICATLPANLSNIRPQMCHYRSICLSGVDTYCLITLICAYWAFKG